MTNQEFRVAPTVLSDNSVVYDVVGFDGQCKITINCTTEVGAINVAHALNNGVDVNSFTIDVLPHLKSS
jgi:hypothetical protein